MKQYILFVMNIDEPAGGLDDLVGCFNSLDEVEKHLFPAEDDDLSETSMEGKLQYEILDTVNGVRVELDGTTVPHDILDNNK